MAKAAAPYCHARLAPVRDPEIDAHRRDDMAKAALPLSGNSYGGKTSACDAAVGAKRARPTKAPRLKDCRRWPDAA